MSAGGYDRPAILSGRAIGRYKCTCNTDGPFFCNINAASMRAYRHASRRYGRQFFMSFLDVFFAEVVSEARQPCHCLCGCDLRKPDKEFFSFLSPVEQMVIKYRGWKKKIKMCTLRQFSNSNKKSVTCLFFDAVFFIRV
jgi:hypothetical protein